MLGLARALIDAAWAADAAVLDAGRGVTGHVRLGFSSALINRFNVLAKQGGFVPTIRTIALDSWTMLVLVGAGMGVAVMLDSVVDIVTEPNVTFVPLAESNRFIDLQIIWRTGDNNPALRSVLEVVDEVYPS
ncbi:LysR substrate-binding domain-containing protein [Corynebacterium argentoratense]|uniref:LysR substrate-binding domain-containing protein n=1 Tax=Corynebacterium argentoratense TaxID=42817 RepID=UPI0028D5344C|nr:LysR substrate-binding domain-containing protein [Corynebacterium argentoratense]